MVRSRYEQGATEEKAESTESPREDITGAELQGVVWAGKEIFFKVRGAHGQKAQHVPGTMASYKHLKSIGKCHVIGAGAVHRQVTTAELLAFVHGQPLFLTPKASVDF